MPAIPGKDQLIQAATTHHAQFSAVGNQLNQDYYRQITTSVQHAISEYIAAIETQQSILEVARLHLDAERGNEVAVKKLDGIIRCLDSANDIAVEIERQAQTIARNIPDSPEKGFNWFSLLSSADLSSLMLGFVSANIPIFGRRLNTQVLAQELKKLSEEDHNSYVIVQKLLQQNRNLFLCNLLFTLKDLHPQSSDQFVVCTLVKNIDDISRDFAVDLGKKNPQAGRFERIKDRLSQKGTRAVLRAGRIPIPILGDTFISASTTATVKATIDFVKEQFKMYGGKDRNIRNMLEMSQDLRQLLGNDNIYLAAIYGYKDEQGFEHEGLLEHNHHYLIRLEQRELKEAKDRVIAIQDILLGSPQLTKQNQEKIIQLLEQIRDKAPYQRGVKSDDLVRRDPRKQFYLENINERINKLIGDFSKDSIDRVEQVQTLCSYLNVLIEYSQDISRQLVDYHHNELVDIFSMNDKFRTVREIILEFVSEKDDKKWRRLSEFLRLKIDVLLEEIPLPISAHEFEAFLISPNGHIKDGMNDGLAPFYSFGELKNFPSDIDALYIYHSKLVDYISMLKEVLQNTDVDSKKKEVINGYCQKLGLKKEQFESFVHYYINELVLTHGVDPADIKLDRLGFNIDERRALHELAGSLEPVRVEVPGMSSHSFVGRVWGLFGINPSIEKVEYFAPTDGTPQAREMEQETSSDSQYHQAQAARDMEGQITQSRRKEKPAIFRLFRKVKRPDPEQGGTSGGAPSP